MPSSFSLKVGPECAGHRLDLYLTEQLTDLSRSKVQKLIESGRVTVNGRELPSRTRLETGDLIVGKLDLPKQPGSLPQDIPVEVVFEDEHLAVINKPRGLAVHPGSGRPDGTLVNALASLYGTLPDGSDPDRPGIVHRLDKDTSGLLVVARTPHAMTRLQTMIADHDIQRRYIALAWGSPRFNKAVVDASIGRDPKHPEKMAVLPESGPARSRSSVTHLEVVERFDVAALMHATLETGRTHQIRVHAAYAGHPLVGDPLYCKTTSLPEPYTLADSRIFDRLLGSLSGQALHAAHLEFEHPVTSQALSFECAPPQAMLDVVDFFREHTLHPEHR